MRPVSARLSCAVILLSLACAGVWAQRRPAGGKAPSASQPNAAAQKAKKGAVAAAGEAGVARNAELDEIVKLAPAERVERLLAFLGGSPDEASRLRAQELLTVARAALGDEMLRASDRLAGVGLFRAAVAEAPEEMSDRLFFEVVSQLPANLYLLGEREAAIDLARAVESRAGSSATRLLSVAAFYLSIERPEEAARVAGGAAALDPDLAAAHQALGAAYRVGLRLNDAAAAYRRALELDPQSANARRSLADLLRATGRPEEALALYRQQLEAEPADAGARAGVVLSLFDAGQRAEAERELEAALFDQAGNLPLLVGAAYWYAAQGEGARALELAERAVALEPRYRWVWARVAHARALLALNRPLEAERSLRAARELGSFPTLDYELARALLSAGLYEEAAEELSRSFSVRGGRIEARLAGRVLSRSESFGDLLAPERRAGLFHYQNADSAATERMLKALLTLHRATGREGGGPDAKEAAAAAREFAAGEDPMRAYRSLYAAARLSRGGVSGRVAFEQAEAAIEGVEAALRAPLGALALFAEELRGARERARDTGEVLAVPEVPRDRLSKVLRGRIEEEAGWALFNEGQTVEAVVRLRRAVSVLPENTDWWRSAQWRLGAALEASGSRRDALAAYVRSYRLAPDPARRAVIESLYRRLNNDSTAGLEALLEEPRTASAGFAPQPLTPAAPQPETDAPAPAEPAASPEDDGPAAPVGKSAGEESDESRSDATDVKGLAAEPEGEPEPEPESATESPTQPLPSATPEATTAAPAEPPDPRREEADDPPAEKDPAETSPDTPPPAPTRHDATPEPTPAAAPAREEPAPEREPVRAGGARQSRPASRAAEGGTPAAPGRCALVVGEEPLAIRSNGGSATFAVSLENYAGPTPPRISPSTTAWSDIIVLAEPRTEADGAGARFTVTSVSSKTGTFVVTVASPCGKRQVTVEVR